MRFANAALLAGALGVLAFSSLLMHGALPGATWSRFPVHLDEYQHWGYAKAAAEQQTTQVGNPFSGRALSEGTLLLKERGFHTYAAAFQQVSGLEWPDLMLGTTVAVAILLGLAVYIVAQRWDAGIFAVLLLAAVPTTIRFLGFGFFVPIAFGLPLFVLGVDALLRLREGSFLTYAVIAAALWAVHPMPGVMLVLVTVAYTALAWHRADGRLIAATLVSLGALALAWPIYEHYIEWGFTPAKLPIGIEEFRGSILVLATAGVGAALASRIADWHDRVAAYALALLALFLESVLVFRIATGIDPFVLYDRSFLVVHMLTAVLAAIALARAWRYARDAAARGARVAATLAVLLALVVPTVAIATSWQEQSEERKYVTLTDARYAAYVEAAEKLDRRAPRALVDGVPTMAFTDVTGVPTPLFVRTPVGSPTPIYIDQFFGTGAMNTTMLLKTRTTLVVTDREVHNPDLEPLAPGVYQLRAELLEQVVAASRP